MVDRPQSARTLQTVPPLSEHDPMLGLVIGGRFRVVSLIARGGMGRVYRAEQAPLGRACAIKVVNAGFGAIDPEFHRRFFLEASISSKLTHPNTVTVFDYGKTDDDLYYMAMELLEGRTLHRALREDGPFPEDRVLHVARQVCRSLREAHTHNVIHRDLKPANVFLVTHGDERDFVKVLDFGLVKNMDERPEEQLTQTGLFMGSPKYMAPEQIEGLKVDGRTDIYSLGIIMYEMLTGRVPFERNSSVNTLMAHVHEPVPPMRVSHPQIQISPVLEAIVLRCLAKQVDERHTSMDDLLADFKNVDGGGGHGPYESRSSWRARASSRPPSRSDMSAISSVHVRAEPYVATGQTHALPGSAGLSGSGASAAASASNAHVAASVRAPAHTLVVTMPRRTLAQARRSPSRRMVSMLILMAIAIGGALGFLLYVMSQRAARGNGRPQGSSLALATGAPSHVALASHAANVAALPPQVTLTGAPADGPLGVAPSSSVFIATQSVALTSEPPGARVLEGTAVLCPATPCMLPLKEGDTKRMHLLVFAKPGFAIETRHVPLSAPIHVYLARFHAAAAQPKAAPSEPSPAAPEPTPSGFKGAPY
jgi:eukaryotic-like serine/threonine-protein kinase